MVFYCKLQVHLNEKSLPNKANPSPSHTYPYTKKGARAEKSFVKESREEEWQSFIAEVSKLRLRAKFDHYLFSESLKQRRALR